MLPGGLNIIGIFAMAPPDMMKLACNGKLRQVSDRKIHVKNLPVGQVVWRIH